MLTAGFRLQAPASSEGLVAFGVLGSCSETFKTQEAMQLARGE